MVRGIPKLGTKCPRSKASQYIELCASFNVKEEAQRPEPERAREGQTDNEASDTSTYLGAPGFDYPVPMRAMWVIDAITQRPYKSEPPGHSKLIRDTTSSRHSAAESKCTRCTTMRNSSQMPMMSMMSKSNRLKGSMCRRCTTTSTSTWSTMGA